MVLFAHITERVAGCGIASYGGYRQLDCQTDSQWVY